MSDQILTRVTTEIVMENAFTKLLNAMEGVHQIMYPVEVAAWKLGVTCTETTDNVEVLAHTKSINVVGHVLKDIFHVETQDALKTLLLETIIPVAPAAFISIAGLLIIIVNVEIDAFIGKIS